MFVHAVTCTFDIFSDLVNNCNNKQNRLVQLGKSLSIPIYCDSIQETVTICLFYVFCLPFFAHGLTFFVVLVVKVFFLFSPSFFFSRLLPLDL